MASISLLATGLLHTAWRASRSADSARRAQQVVRALDEAAVQAVATYAQDSLTRHDLAQRVWRPDAHVEAIRVRSSWQRTHPLVAWLELDAQPAATSGPPGTLVARRTERRAFWLAPPVVPRESPLTALAMVEGEDGVTISETAPLATSWCPGTYVLPSVPPVVAADVSPDSGRLWSTMPAWRATTSAQRDAVENGWADVLARLPAHANTDAVQSPISDPGWRARRFDVPLLTLRGPLRWNGLLVVNGNVVIEGQVELRGLLMVRRSLDARAGQLTVHGAVIANDAATDVVQLGPSSRLQFDPCAVDLALATLARPRAAVFGIRTPGRGW
ncbi:hypothetical protein [Gemmatimonas sp. UBA7669]|uniref:hypothetical protein n=1 Tax=Gemmatimonas sp. UBA7669 TaxID=1946568 RepID=UPI0025B88B18|nr:hypothetical protein [Gemmatimonas sp. UBA7669]